MARFSGRIGFVQQVETKPGVYTEEAIERRYTGDMIRIMRQTGAGDGRNDDLTMSSVVEIVADAYARENLTGIRYVKWMGGVWKIASVEVRHPRLVLTLGGVYHGETQS